MDVDSLTEKQRLLVDIYRSAAIATAIVDPDGIVLWQNDAACTKFDEIFATGNIKGYLSFFNCDGIFGKLKTGQSIMVNNSELPFSSYTIHLLPVLQAQALDFVLVQINETAIMNAATSDQTQEIISNVSGQFRQPISIIFSALGPLMRKFEENEDYVGQEYIKNITQNCYKLLRNTTNITDITRYYKNDKIYTPKQGDLNEFLSNICQSAALLIRPTNTPLVYAGPSEPLYTVFDPDKLTYAIANLILNACLYAGEDNVIKVTLTRNNNIALITLADKGYGINEKELTKLFVPYYTGSDMCGAPNGLGLGLAVVNRIIQMHKGSIVVNSIENEGTTFAISLPVVEDGSLPSFRANEINYLTNHFSPLFIGLANVCTFYC